MEMNVLEEPHKLHYMPPAAEGAVVSQVEARYMSLFQAVEDLLLLLLLLLSCSSIY